MKDSTRHILSESILCAIAYDFFSPLTRLLTRDPLHRLEIIAERATRKHRFGVYGHNGDRTKYVQENLEDIAREFSAAKHEHPHKAVLLYADCIQHLPEDERERHFDTFMKAELAHILSNTAPATAGPLIQDSVQYIVPKQQIAAYIVSQKWAISRAFEASNRGARSILSAIRNDVTQPSDKVRVFEALQPTLETFLSRPETFDTPHYHLVRDIYSAFTEVGKPVPSYAINAHREIMLESVDVIFAAATMQPAKRAELIGNQLSIIRTIGITPEDPIVVAEDPTSKAKLYRVDTSTMDGQGQRLDILCHLAPAHRMISERVILADPSQSNIQRFFSLAVNPAATQLRVGGNVVEALYGNISGQRAIGRWTGYTDVTPAS